MSTDQEFLSRATEATENAILADLAGRLGGTIVQEMTEGGSPARLVQVRRPEGRLEVIKLLVDNPGAVDGHDLKSFRIKIRQIEKILKERPELRDVYTDLNQEFHGENWSAYTMPFYPNRDVARSLREGIPPLEGFHIELRPVLNDLISHGYLSSSTPTSPGHVADVHGERLARRFWLLRKHLPTELTDPHEIVVNGWRCRNPLKLSRKLADSPSLTMKVDPERLYYPVHGDLNTRNILVIDGGRPQEGGGYRIIDPRGTVQHWDPAYDLSKILFSLSVWDGGLRKGFDITGPTSEGWTVAIRGGNYPQYTAAARGLLGFLHELPSFQELTSQDPGWESRYLLGHAFHLLGEAACRLSDIKKRTGEEASPLSPVDLAVGHYLYGVLFLENAIHQLETRQRIDHDSALALLPD